MTEERKKKLERNFSLMFWVQAFINFKLMNLVSTLFYVHRGLTLSEVFYTAIVFSVTNIIFEIPSSYLADKWGRKKTIILAMVFAVLSCLVQIIAFDFYSFIVSFIFLAISFACMSGTDIALIYDTNKELGNEDKSLSKLGNYFSARQLFKIFTPIIAAFIAKDLLEWQFMLILAVDIFVLVIAFILVLRITEPNHRMDLEKVEAGALLDAFKLIRTNWKLSKVIIGKTITFTSAFMIWRFHQQFLLDLGVSLIILGISWGVFNLITFIFNQYVVKFFSAKALSHRINLLNYLLALVSFVLLMFILIFPNPYILLILICGFIMTEVIRSPFYSELFNKISFSHNRATTLSMMNFLKSIFDVPILLLAAFLIGINVSYVFVLSFILCLVTITFLRVPENLFKKAI